MPLRNDACFKARGDHTRFGHFNYYLKNVTFVVIRELNTSLFRVPVSSNKPGTAQVGPISKAQKQQKDSQVFSSTVPEKPKS